MYGRLTGSYPETGLEEMSGDLLEADARPGGHDDLYFLSQK
jgi:hypothetical protein